MRGGLGPVYIEMPVSRQEVKQPCINVLGLSIFPLSTIFTLDSGTFSTVWYVSFFILLPFYNMIFSQYILITLQNHIMLLVKPSSPLHSYNLAFVFMSNLSKLWYFGKYTPGVNIENLTLDCSIYLYKYKSRTIFDTLQRWIDVQ